MGRIKAIYFNLATKLLISESHLIHSPRPFVVAMLKRSIIVHIIQQLREDSAVTSRLALTEFTGLFEFTKAEPISWVEKSIHIDLSFFYVRTTGGNLMSHA